MVRWDNIILIRPDDTFMRRRGTASHSLVAKYGDYSLMTEFNMASKRVIQKLEIHKDIKDDVVRKNLTDLNREATKLAKAKKVYVVIFADK